ncbi:MAG: sialidase family protein, partial [Acidobacteriaceae bacterium]
MQRSTEPQSILQRFRWIVIISLMFTAPFLMAQALPPAPGTQIFNLTAPGFYSEPGVAINPRNPQQVVAVFQDYAHAAFSMNAGKHWTVASGVKSQRYRVSGDVPTVFDAKGHAIICYMAFDKLGTFNYWGHNSSRNGLYIRRSLDGGKTWEQPDHEIIAHPTEPGVPWEDKPYIVSDTTAGPYSGNLYVGWTRWTLTNSQILFTRSTDDGLTWSKPIEVDKHPGLPRDDNGALEGFDGAVGSHGELYVVWAGDNHIQFAASRNGGKTFSTPRNIIPTAPIMFQVERVARSNGFPQIAVDPRDRGKRLYVTWS